MIVRPKLLLALILLAASSAFAQDAPAVAPAAAGGSFVPTGRPGDAIGVSLVTFQPGTEYWQRFGHDAILLRDAETGRATTYNYGLFDFRQKNFFLNFARGLMNYRVAPNRLVNDLHIYEEDGRWALEQKLDLTPDQRGLLRDFLEWNVQPEHRDYPYDYFVSNCSTRVRDALDRALGGALHEQLQGQATGYDYRTEALRLISPDLLLMIAMDAALGPTADKPIDLWQQSFGPMTLMQAVRKVTVKDGEGAERPLVESETWLLPRTDLPDPPLLPPGLNLPFLLTGLAFAALLLMLSKARRNLAARLLFALSSGAFAIVSGIAGVILLSIWTVTDHWGGWHNENLLLMSPLALLLLPALIMSVSARWNPGRLSRFVAVLIVAGCLAEIFLRLIPGAFQDNLHWLLLFLPIQIALAICLRSRSRDIALPVVRRAA